MRRVAQFARVLFVFSLLTAIAAVGWLTPAARAASLTWDTTPGTVGVGNGSVESDDGVWNTSNGNWTVDGGANNIAWVNGTDTAVFGVFAAGVTLGEAITAGGLTFNAEPTAAYSITGNTLTLAGTAPAITANYNAVINSALAGTAGFTLAGTGVLTLGSTDSNSGLSGNINITGPGTLRFGADDKLGSGTTTISLGNGATLNYTGGAYAPGSTRIFSVPGGNTATFDSNGSALTLGTSGQVAGGGTLVRSGTAGAAGDSVLGNLGAVAAGTTLQINSGRVYATAGAGTVTGNFALSSGSLYAGSQAYTFAGNLTIGAGSNSLALNDIDGTTGRLMTLSGAVGGAGNVSVSTGAGAVQTLTLTNTGNNMSGTWTLGGNVTLAAQAAAGTGNVLGTSSTILLNSGSLLNLYDQGDNTGSVQNLASGGGVTVAANTAITVNRAGAIALNKNLRMGALNIGANTLTVNNNNGYGLEFTGAATLTGAPTFSVATVNASNALPGLVLSGLVNGGGTGSGVVTFTKSGAGTLVLGNTANSFGTGGSIIEVTGGVLQVASDGALGDAANVVKLSSATQALRTAGTFATARTITLNANTGIDVTAGNTLTLSSPFTGAATNTFTKGDNGTLAFTAAANNSGFTGGWTISAGALRIAAAANLNNGTLTLTNAVGSALQLSNNLTFSTPLTLNNSGINSAGQLESYSGNNAYTGVLTLGAASVIGADAGSTLNLGGTVTATSPSALTFNPASGATINMNFSLSGTAVTPITQIGGGTLGVSVNSPSLVSALSVNAGTFLVSSAGSLGSTAATISVTTAATNSAKATLTSATLPTGFGVGSSLLGQTVAYISGTTVVLSGYANAAVSSATALPFVSGVVTQPGTAISLDNSGSYVTNRLGGRALTLAGAAFTMTPSTTADVTETVSTLVFLPGQSVVTLTADPGRATTFTASNLSTINPLTPVNQGNTTLIRGSNFGSISGSGVATFTYGTTASPFIGTKTASGTPTTQGIMPYIITGTSTTDLGSSFATASGTSGLVNLRPLAAGELAPSITAGANVSLSGTATSSAAATINSLTMTSTAGITNTTPAFPTLPYALTVSSGGLLATGTNTISGGVLAPGNLYAYTPGSASLTISSMLNATTLTKAGAGTLLLSSTSGAYPGFSQNWFSCLNNHNGAFVINEGTLKLGADDSVPFYYLPNTPYGMNDQNTITVNPGATLDLNGHMQFVGAIQSYGGANMVAQQSMALGTGISGGTIGSSTGFGSIVACPGNPSNATQVTPVSIQGANVGYFKYGGSQSTYLTAANTYGGPTLLVGQPVVLFDNGTMSNTKVISINNGTLTVDNTGLTNINGRLNPSGTVNLSYSSLTFKGRAQTASTEAVGPLNAVLGYSTVTVTPGGGSAVNSADLTVASLGQANDATINFLPAALGSIGSNAHININGATPASLAAAGTMLNNIIPWALVNGAEFAGYIPYSSGGGVTVGGLGALNGAGYLGYDATSIPGSDQPSQNIKVGASAISSNLKLNSLNATGALTFGASATTLDVTSGGLIVNGAVGTAALPGVLTAGATTATGTTDLYLYKATTLNSAVVDTLTAFPATSTCKVRLVISGGNITITNSNNSYTGGTVMNGNTMTLSATAGTMIPNAAVAANGLVLNGAIVTESNSPGQIASGNIVTLNGVSTLNLFGNNTLAGLILNNNGVTAPTVKTWNAATNLTNTNGMLTLTGTAAITAISNNIVSPATINGRLGLPSSATLNIGPASFNGQIINPVAPDLILTGLVGGGGTITKSGSGVVQFNTATVLSGTLDVTAGGIQAGAAGAGARLADVILERGAWLNLNMYAATSSNFGSLAGAGEVTNGYTSGTLPTLTVGFDGSSTTFSGTFMRFSDTLVNAINLTKIGAGTMTMTGTGSTASGTLVVSGGGLTFKDNGVNNFVSATVIVNQGGALTLDNSGAANVSNRLANTATNLGLTLNGGTFTYLGADAAVSTESNGTGALTLGSGESTITSTPGAGGTNTLTFGSLVQNAGGTAIFAGTGLSTSSNKIFMSALTMTNRILPRIAVGADFATYNENGMGSINSNGLQAVSAYDPATDINAVVNNTGNMKTSTTTGLRLTAAKTINSVNISTNNATLDTNGTVLPTAGLTLTSGGVLVNGNSATISTPVLLLSAEGIFRVNGNSLNVASALTGGSGITKTGTGTLTLAAAEAYTSTTTVNQGAVVLAGGKNTLLAYQNGSTVNSAPSVTALNVNGGTLDLNGNSQLVGQINSANTLAGGGGVITNSSLTPATLTSYATSANTFGGRITGNLNVTLASSIGGNLTQAKGPLITLTDQQSYTGNTIVHNGQVTLKDQGALYVGVGGTPNIELDFAAVSLDNTGLNPTATPPVRVPTNATFTLNQGVILTEPGASVDNAWNLGTVTVGRSINTIIKGLTSGFTTRAGTTLADSSGATETLTINNLQTAGNGAIAELRMPIDSQASRLLINNVSGGTVAAGVMLPPWVLVTTGGDVTALGDFAALSATGYGIVDYGNTAKGAPGYVSGFASGNVTSVAATTLSAASTTTKALKLTGSLTFSAPGNSLNIESGGLLSVGKDIGDSTNRGVLTAGGTATGGTTDLYLVNVAPRPTGSGTLTNYADIKDTKDVIGSGTAKVRLVLVSGYQPSSGGPVPSAITLAGSNTYSGGTIIMGQVHMQSTNPPIILAANTNIPAGGLTLYANSFLQCALTTTAPNQINQANDVTIMNSGYGLTMMAGSTNTLSSLIFNNQGGMGSPLVNTSNNLILSGTGPLAAASGYVIDSTNDHYYTIPNIQGTLLTVPDGATINTAGSAPISLIVAAQLSTSGSTLPLHKTGPGSVVLSFANTFANGVNLDQGSIIFNANTTPTSGTVTSGPLGTGVLTLANSTAIMSDGTARTIANLVNVGSNAGFTFGTLDAASVRANAGNSLTLSNTVTLSGNNTINVNGLLMVGTISGKLTGGSSLTKGGPGTLVLSNAANDYGGATTVNGGLLQLGAAGAVPATTDLTVLAGAAFDMYNFNQTVNSLSGAGLVINSQNAVRTLTVGGTTPNAVFSGVLAATTPANLVVTKTGANTQVLSGLCTYTGSTSVTQGTLQFGKEVSLYNNGAAAAWSATNIVVNGGATLALNVGGSGEFTAANIDALKVLGTASGGFTNGAILGLDTTNASGGSFTYSGTIANTNANANVLGLTKLGIGTLALTALNTYSGKTRVQAGVLEFNSINNIGLASALGAPADAASGQIDLATPSSPATLRFVGSAYGTDRIVNLLGNGTIDASGTSAGDPLGLNGPVTGSGNLTLTGTGLGEVAGAISSTGSLTKQGTGRWTLSNTNNSYTGPTTVNAGTLEIDQPGALPTGNNLTISSGGHVVLASGLSHAISLGGLTITSGAGASFGAGLPTPPASGAWSGDPAPTPSLAVGGAPAAPTPEPATVVLLAAGVLAGLVAGRRRWHAN